MFFRRAHVPNPSFQERLATLEGAGRAARVIGEVVDDGPGVRYQ